MLVCVDCRWLFMLFSLLGRVVMLLVNVVSSGFGVLVFVNSCCSVVLLLFCSIMWLFCLLFIIVCMCVGGLRVVLGVGWWLGWFVMEWILGLVGIGFSILVWLLRVWMVRMGDRMLYWRWWCVWCCWGWLVWLVGWFCVGCWMICVVVLWLFWFVVCWCWFMGSWRIWCWFLMCCLFCLNGCVWMWLFVCWVVLWFRLVVVRFFIVLIMIICWCLYVW